MIDATNISTYDLGSFDTVGFASGIYYSKFHKSVLEFAKNNLPEGKKVFFVYTYGAEKEGYTKAIREAIADKNANILGEYGCFGFNTFGPFRLIGGIARNHPNEQELDGAVQFYKSL